MRSIVARKAPSEWGASREEDTVAMPLRCALRDIRYVKSTESRTDARWNTDALHCICQVRSQKPTCQSHSS
jgi:hypothetical protein